MKSWVKKPKIDRLKRIVECYWYATDEPKDLMILPPAISNDVLLNLIPPTTIFIDENEQYSLKGNYYSGIRTKFFHVDQHGSFELYGLRFKPWVMTLFFNLPPSRHVNIFSPIDESSKQLIMFNELRKHAKSGASPDRIVELFDSFLLANCSFEEETHHKFERIFDYSRLISKITVAELAAKTHFSTSTIERLFKKYIGVTPKTVFRILRYNDIWSALNDPKYATWADVIFEFGYFDQAHFIKEFKNFTGKSPDNYMKERNSTLDRYRLY